MEKRNLTIENRKTMFPSDTFVFAFHRALPLETRVEARGATGRIVAQLTLQEYIEEWSASGYHDYGICRHPNFFYRVEKDRELTGLQRMRSEREREY